MYLDFEDYRPDIQPIGRAISWREGVLLSIIVHLATLGEGGPTGTFQDENGNVPW